MTDDHWKDAFEILERAQSLPLDERMAFAGTQTADRRTLDLVARLIEERDDSEEEEAALSPGQRFGQYEIIAKLGQGGSGEVFSARDTELDRPVALKFLSREVLAPGAKAAEMLIREAKAASALNHSNIVTIHGVARDEASGRTAIAMELVEGKALRHYCVRDSPQPVERGLRWGRQIASALAAAHASEIVHRDIKPENIVVRESDGNVKVLDFGLARRKTLGHESSRSAPAGVTIDYCSPEQVAAQRPTAASDIFSLGTVLYEVITGQHAFAGETPLDRLYAITNRRQPRASSVRAGISPAIDDLLDSMLAKDPASRPTAARVAQILAESDAAPPSVTPARRRTFYVAAALAAAVALAVGIPWFRQQRAAAVKDSIAVLALRNSDPSLAYLSDGLRHEIALALAMTPGLRVAARESSIDAKAPGRELGVASILSGSVSHTGRHVLLDLELKDTGSGVTMWSGQFQQPLQEISAFPGEVSARIAAKLGARVGPPSRMTAQRKPEAYEAYLRARYHFIKRTRQDMALASENCERAVAIEPGFAEAWALLAASQGFTPGMYNSLSPAELYAKTRGAIDRAIAIDPDLPEVHLTLGAIKFFQDRDWPGAEQDLLRAIALNPSDSQAHLFLAILMRVLGRGAEEREYVRRARTLDPLSPLVANHVAWTEYFRGNDAGALGELEKAIALDASFSANQTLLGYIRLRQRHFPEAVEAFQKATRTAAGQASLGDLGFAHAVSGDRAAALRILRELESGRKGYTPSGAVAWIHLGLGDRDRAFHWFGKACDENYQWLNYVRIWPVYDALRSDPRMQTLIHRLRLD